MRDKTWTILSAQGITIFDDYLPLEMNALWVLSADIVPPAKPARRLSAHVSFSHMLLVGCLRNLRMYYLFIFMVWVVRK